MNEDREPKKYWTNEERYKTLAEIIPLKTPLSILLEPTNRCNFRCKFCPTGHKNLLEKVGRPLGDMKIEFFKKIIHDIQEFPDKMDKISLYKDGEPLLHPFLPEMIEIIKNADICKEVSVTSNTALLTKDLAIKMVKSGLDSFRVSFEALSDVRYKELTQTNTKNAKIKENIKNLYLARIELKKTNPSIYIKINDYKLTDQEKSMFYSEFSDIADELSIEKFMNWDNSHGLQLQLQQNKKSDSVNKENLHRRQVCPRPWYTLAINFNGKVSICCVDWSYNTIVGDLKKESLKDIWNGPRLYNFRKMHADNRRKENVVCRNCEYLNDHQKKSELDEIAKTNINKLLAKPQYN